MFDSNLQKRMKGVLVLSRRGVLAAGRGEEGNPTGNGGSGGGGGPFGGRLRAGFSSGSEFIGWLAAGLLLVMGTGCGGGPGPEVGAVPEEAPSVEGRYHGLISVDGQPFEVLGHVRQDGSRLQVVVSLPSGIDARGEGHLRGRVVRIELDYGSGCPGTLILQGTVVDRGRRLTGSVEARDCTGEATGSFHLDRP